MKMPKRFSLKPLFMIVCALFLFSCSENKQTVVQDDQTIRVVSTIKPLHFIADALLKEVGESTWLIKSPDVHGYQLTPSDIKLINRSDMLIGIGEFFEGNVTELFTEKDFSFDDYQAKLALLPLRDGLIWGDHDHVSHDEHDEHEIHAKHIDMHFWLSSKNALLFAKALSEKLIQIFPQHAFKIEQNLEHFVQEINALEISIKQRLAQSEPPSFMVFHDGFHYFTHQFGLEEQAAIVSDPSQQVGIKTLLELKDLMVKTKVSCIFVEPGFNESLTKTLLESVESESKVKVKILYWDPIGMKAERYQDLIMGLFDGYLDCK
ncbi:metal ABC transporter solute-binding protein, Zn/Mn family [Marinicellulosiphila megalodicopiae]|uniref:metal ABC transporter solute-binding protein, Zn/Mn family n=1 Tax=Marinicellulosiphila megalodicopiae TaxID=2724896 RepID=UPI003BAEA257